MVGISNPPEWEHSSGYRLNADGKSIVYTHTKRNSEIFIEAMVDEEAPQDGLTFWGLLTEDGREIEGPERFNSKEKAIEWIETTMDQHQ